MTFSFDGVIVRFTGGDWRIVRGTITVKSLLAAQKNPRFQKMILSSCWSAGNPLLNVARDLEKILRAA